MWSESYIFYEQQYSQQLKYTLDYAETVALGLAAPHHISTHKHNWLENVLTYLFSRRDRSTCSC